MKLSWLSKDIQDTIDRFDLYQMRLESVNEVSDYP